MEHRRPAVEEMPGRERAHEARLTAVLREPVEDRGRVEAAQLLEVNYKTLARSVESEPQVRFRRNITKGHGEPAEVLRLCHARVGRIATQEEVQDGLPPAEPSPRRPRRGHGPR